MANDLSTKVTVLRQGDISISSAGGYMLVAGEQCACFFIDPSERAYATLWGESENGCPTISLYPDTNDDAAGTLIEFSDFCGWQVHAINGGKTMAVALTRYR